MLTAFGSGDADAAWWCCKVLLWKLLVHPVNPHGLDLRFLRWSKKGNERRSGMQHISFLHIMIKRDVLYQSDQSVASKPFNMLRPTSQMDKHWMQMDWHRGGDFIVMALWFRCTSFLCDFYTMNISMQTFAVEVSQSQSLLHRADLNLTSLPVNSYQCWLLLDALLAVVGLDPRQSWMYNHWTFFNAWGPVNIQVILLHRADLNLTSLPVNSYQRWLLFWLWVWQ